MKLPDFIIFNPLNQARQQMGATLPDKAPVAKKKPKPVATPLADPATVAVAHGTPVMVAGAGVAGAYVVDENVGRSLRMIKIMLAFILLLLIGNIVMLYQSGDTMRKYVLNTYSGSSAARDGRGANEIWVGDCNNWWR